MSEYLMTGQQLADKCRDIATKHKTLYVMGAFGAPLNAANKARYTGPKANAYNRRPERTAMIHAASSDTFAFDCIGMAVKGPLWGWNADQARVYGGAVYEANGVPDKGADAVITMCRDVSTAFNLDTMKPGEYLWKSGHAGIYLGNGLAAECTPIWSNGAQITACNCTKPGYNTRTWTKHGKLPWVDYTGAEVTVSRDELLAIRAKALAVVAEIQEIIDR